jgi:hypothetical protein
MQDRYSGDVGDFGKLGLLRTLQRGLKLELGVVWYWYPDEGHNEDGRFVEYLDSVHSPYRNCDAELWDQLRGLVHGGRRSVVDLQTAGVLDNATFFDRSTDAYLLHPGLATAAKNARSEYRREWLQDAVDNMRKATMVFLDPDNGLEIKSCSKTHHRKAGKFTFYNEAREFYDQADVLVIYHHLNRHKSHGSHKEQLDSRARELKSRLACDGAVFGLRYRPFSARAFFVAVRGPLVPRVDLVLTEFLTSPWSAFWDDKSVRA